MYIWSIDSVLGPYPTFALNSVQQEKEQKDLFRRSLQAVMLPLPSYLLQSNNI